MALWVSLCVVGASAAEPPQVYDIDLPAEDLADALTGLSEQTGAPVVFPYDLVRNRKVNSVIGRYTLQEALDVLLKDTGLSGGLSNQGVLTISVAKSPTPANGVSPVTDPKKRQQTNRPTRIATLIASVTAAFSASAEEPAANTSAPDEIIVSAQKRDERLQDVPVPVTVLNSDALIETNQTSLHDYYTTIPGVSMQARFTSTTNLSIRGISTGGFLNPTVGITVDDVPFGSSTAGGSGLVVPDVDPGDLSRVEVLRGPQGTLYGASSMGGLLKFVTRDPSTAGFSGRFETGTSTVHNGAEPGFNVRGAVNVPLSDTFAIRLSGFRRQDPGYIDNPRLDLTGVNETHAYGGRLGALWQFSESGTLKLSALYQSTRASGNDEVDVAPGLGDLQQNYIATAGRSNRTVEAYSARLNFKLGGVELTSISGYNINRHFDTFDYTFALGSLTQEKFADGSTMLFTTTETKKFVQEIRLNGSIGSSTDWQLGGFYTDEKTPTYVPVFSAVDPYTGFVRGQEFRNSTASSYKEYAGFADLTYHFTDTFDVQIGGRESHYRYAYGPQVNTGPFVEAFYSAPSPYVVDQLVSTGTPFTYLLTPRLKLSPDLMIYARFASGYRPGGPNNRVPGATPQYDPDKTRTYEMGLKGDFLEHAVSVDSSLYYVDWTNIQIALITPDGLFTYTSNGNSARSDGVELSLATRPFTGVTLTAWIDYDDAVLKESFPSNSTVHAVAGDRLPFTPRFSANLAFEQSFPVGADVNGFIGAQGRYVGDRKGEFQGTSTTRQDFPAYATADLRAGARFDAWTATMYCNNVGDKRGLINGGVGYVPENAFIYIQPRTIGLSLSRTF